MAKFPLFSRIRWQSARVMIPSAAVLLGLAVVGWDRLSAATAQEGSPQSAPPAAIPVPTISAERADVPIYLEGLGAVQAYYTVTVTARVEGQLDKVSFVEGQSVKQGDLLAQIDPRPFQAALDQAIATRARDVAQLAGAKSDLERYVELAPKHLASKQTIDQERALVGQIQGQIKADEASIENARTQLSYTSIVSPIDGVTGIRRIDPGNIVHPTDTTGIVVLTQIQPITSIFTVPEQALPELQRALRAGPVTVDALSRSADSNSDTVLDRGTIKLVNNQIDQTTGTVQVKAVFPNAHETLWPGAFVDTRVLVRTAHGALTIPTSAVQRGPGGVFTYVVKSDSTVEARTLQIGEHSGGQTIVTNGLREGERVVTGNQYRLQPGVRVQNTSGAPANGAPAVAKADGAP
jgi:membrane fusion protein, multidrug efflux system